LGQTHFINAKTFPNKQIVKNEKCCEIFIERNQSVKEIVNYYLQLGRRKLSFSLYSKAVSKDSSLPDVHYGINNRIVHILSVNKI